MIYIGILLALVYTIILYRSTKPELNIINKILLSLLRFVSTLLVILVLLIPVYKFVNVRQEKAKAIILFDKSQSMNHKIAGKAKISINQEVLNALKSELRSNFQLETINFADGIEGDSLNTNLLKSLRELNSRSNDTNSEIFLFSDGYYSDNDISKISDYPFKINTFNYSHIKENDTPKIVSITNNRTSYVDNLSPVEISISSEGKIGQTLIIKEGNKVIASQKVDSSKKLYTTKLTYKLKEVGLHNFDVILQGKDEVFDKRNIVVNVIDDKSKVLIITDTPTWDGRALKDAIGKDDKFEATTAISYKYKLLQKNKEVKINEVLKNIKVLVLNNSGALKFSAGQLASIKKRVSQGMSLFLIGQNMQSLDEYLPTTASNINKSYRGGVRTGINIDRFSTFKDYFEKNRDLSPVDYKYVNLKRNSLSLMTMDNMEMSPAIAYMQVGNSKSLHFNISDFWRWGSRGDYEEFNKFLLNIVNWLNSDFGEDFIVSVDKGGYYLGETVQVKSTIIDEKGDFISNRSIKLELKDSNGKNLKSDYLMWDNENYVYTLDGLSAGRYELSVKDETSKSERKAEFIIYNDNLEKNHKDVNIALLQEIAKQSGGDYYSVENIDEIKNSLKREKRQVEEYREFNLLYNKYLLLLFVLTFSLELFLRKRWGLL
jgi:hypothetical protein